MDRQGPAPHRAGRGGSEYLGRLRKAISRAVRSRPIDQVRPDAWPTSSRPCEPTTATSAAAISSGPAKCEFIQGVGISPHHRRDRQRRHQAPRRPAGSDRDVADVEIDHEIPTGAVTAEGRGEVILGLGFMLLGENSREVTQRLGQKWKRSNAAAAGGRNRRSLGPHRPGRRGAGDRRR